MPLEELLPYVKEELLEADLWRDSFDNEERGWFRMAVDLIRARYHTLKDFSTRGRAYFADEFDFDEAAVKKNLTKEARLREFLPELAERLAGLSDFTAGAVEPVFRSYAEEKGIKGGIIINAARTAVSGTSVGPGLFEMLEVIGQDRVVRRLTKAIDMIPAQIDL